MAILRARTRRSLPLLLAAVVIVATISAGSYYRASGSSHDTTYYACLYAGSLSQVGTTPPANCGRGAQIQWNAEGPPGVPGAAGADGIHCWDLNRNRVNDPAEDVNQDGNFDTLDCQGPQGDQGPPGPSNALDCAGCVDTSDIAPGAVVGGPGGVVLDGTISSDDIAPNAVQGGTGGIIVDGSITSADLAPGSVLGGSGGMIEDGSITADDLAGGSVPTSKTVANAAQGSSSGVIIGGGNAIDTTASAVIHIQDSADHTVQVTAKAYLQCFAACDPTSASVDWSLRATDGSGTTVIAGTYSATVSGTGDVLTVVETALHTTAQGPTTYTLFIRATGATTFSVYGTNVTAVDLGRTPTP